MANAYVTFEIIEAVGTNPPAPNEYTVTDWDGTDYTADRSSNSPTPLILDSESEEMKDLCAKLTDDTKPPRIHFN